MFGFFKGKNSITPADFRDAVDRRLVEDGYDPAWLASLLPDNALKIERLYNMLRTKGLEAVHAAKAIEVGTHFFNEKKDEAAESDWPLKYTDKIPDEYTREECFFLEQVTEAVTGIIKKKKSVSSCLGFGSC